jgi:hypothetical protein
MSLRESASEAAARRVDAARRPPIDLDHLRKQTIGNRELEKEVLRLFLGQATECVGKIKAAATVPERSEAAHALVGSARGVGAFSVAYIASEIELAKGPVTGRLLALERATEAARFFIADLLAE